MLKNFINSLAKTIQGIRIMSATLDRINAAVTKIQTDITDIKQILTNAAASSDGLSQTEALDLATRLEGIATSLDALDTPIIPPVVPTTVPTGETVVPPAAG